MDKTDLTQYAKHDLEVFAAYVDNDHDILLSSSGGIATAFARHVLKNGGKVAGVIYDDDFMGASYTLIDSESQINKLKGSKVINVKIGNIFQVVKNELDLGTNILFFALPCVAAGLRKFLGDKYDNIIICELICSGKVSAKIHKDYCSRIEKKHKSNINSFTIRGKKDGWLPEYLVATFANGKVFCREFKRTEYGQAFKIMKDEACLSCHFKGNNRCGDLMIGDFWGAEKNDPFWNPNGISVVFIETDVGKVFFEGINDIKKWPVTFEKAVASNLSVVRSQKAHDEREMLVSSFKHNDLFKTMSKSKTMRHIKRVDFVRNIPFVGKIFRKR